MHAAAESLASAQSARGYRAMLLFLAAVYANYSGRQKGDDVLLKTASGMADKSVLAATPATWMRAILPLPEDPERGRTGVDLVAVKALSSAVAAATNTGKVDKTIKSMQEGLATVSHKTFEPALSILGELLGAKAWKPGGDARADSVWCWDDELWTTIEAKSEHLEGGQVGIEDVRNTNHHLQLLAEDRGVDIPNGSVSVVVSPLPIVKHDAQVIAADHTYLIHPDALISMAESAERLWKRILTLRNITVDADREVGIADALRDFRLFPSDIIDALTERQLGS